MALTKSDLGEIRKIVTGIVIEASESILAGVKKMFEVRDKRLEKIDKRLDNVEGKLTGFAAEQRYLKDEVKGLKGEFAKQVSKREFNELKSRVDGYHPAS